MQIFRAICCEIMPLAVDAHTRPIKYATNYAMPEWWGSQPTAIIYVAVNPSCLRILTRFTFSAPGTADPDTDTDSGCLYCLFNMCTVAWITSSSNSRNISGSNGNKDYSLSYAAHLKRQRSAIVAFAAITMSSLLLLYRLFRPIFRPPPTLSFSTPIMSENLK